MAPSCLRSTYLGDGGYISGLVLHIWTMGCYISGRLLHIQSFSIVLFTTYWTWAIGLCKNISYCTLLLACSELFWGTWDHNHPYWFQMGFRMMDCCRWVRPGHMTQTAQSYNYSIFYLNNIPWPIANPNDPQQLIKCHKWQRYQQPQFIITTIGKK